MLEDEFHFVCCCPAYSAIRKHYLFFEYANYNTFVNIMSSVDIKIVQIIAAYTHQSLKLRSALVELEGQIM